MKTHTINKNGMQQIVEQLKAKCKPSVFNGWLDDDLIDSRESKEMLSAWASDLEETLDSENGDEIEISEHQTISGHTEFIYVTDEGIDTTVISRMSINIDFDDTVEVTAINGVGETETFHVQTTDGLFRSDLGCWILAPGNDGDIDQDDYPFFDFDLIVSEAEKYVRDTYEIKETANSELYFKVYNNKVEIVELNRHFINSDSSSYQTEYKLVETFDDEDDADKYITERTKSTK